jgi:lipoate-protein ligase A
MELYNLGKAPWEESQLIYHALARLGREALVLVSPASPYACLGFHQDADQEVDLEFCRSRHIPVFRREVGGGTVYLDGDQLFFQLIMHRDHPAIPMKKENFYRKFLEPIINTYRRIGIEAEYKPINDVLAGGRKISGTGVGEIGECLVFVGNLILDFNYKMMSLVLKTPDEKFRDHVYKTMEENMTTIRRELNADQAGQWAETDLNAIMVEEFENVLDPFSPGNMDEALANKVAELGKWMFDPDWLMRKGRRLNHREVKIRQGVVVTERTHKAPGGLIRAGFEMHEGRLSKLAISGDFFCYPSDSVDRLAAALEGRYRDEVPQALADFYQQYEPETPGISQEDWLEVFQF